jgi:hypothetical protein
LLVVFCFDDCCFKVFLHPLTQEEVRSLSGVISAVKTQAKGKAGVTLRNTKAKRQNNKLLSQLDVQFVSDFFGALLKVGGDVSKSHLLV